MSKIATFSAFGVPWDDLRNIFTELSQMANCGTKWRRNIAENFNRLNSVHERYRRQTTDRRQIDDYLRRHIANMNMSSSSLIILTYLAPFTIPSQCKLLPKFLLTTVVLRSLKVSTLAITANLPNRYSASS